MDLIIIGLIGIFVLIIFLLLGVPVGFAMAIVGFIGFSYLTSIGAGLNMIPLDIFSNFVSYNLLSIPLFVLMGTIAFEAGISGRLYDAAYSLFGRMRGGLAMATIVACAGFAAICGSTNASAAAMGKVAIPQMKRYNYDDSLNTGSVAAGGSLGILIPPSTLLIIYGILTEQSIGKLFISGILPGILLASLFIIAIVLICWYRPNIAPAGAATTIKQKLAGFTGLIETLIIFALIMGGLFAGWFTPSQAGGAGAACALLLALSRRQMGWKGFVKALKDTVPITSMVMIIVSGAIIFGRFIAVTQIAFVLAEWIMNLSVPTVFIILGIFLIHLAGGCFMDSFALIVLTVPIFFPVIMTLGYDPIWYGVLIVLFVEMGVITPPVGINVFVIKSIAKDVPLSAIYRGTLPFLVAEAVCVILLIMFPKIVTFLPSFMTY